MQCMIKSNYGQTVDIVDIYHDLWGFRKSSQQKKTNKWESGSTSKSAPIFQPKDTLLEADPGGWKLQIWRCLLDLFPPGKMKN